MPINQPYDPRYNAKIYIPKLTEEQRRAHATPLENLRSLRFRTETPAAPSKAEEVVPAHVATQVAPAAPSPTEDLVPDKVAPAAPSPAEDVVPAPTPAQEAPTSDYVPSAREILFAEFPGLFPLPYQEVNGEVLVEAKCVVGEPRLVGCDCESPHKNRADARSRHVERKPRSVQRPKCHTSTDPASYRRKKQLQHGNQPQILNNSRARLPGLILSIL